MYHYLSFRSNMLSRRWIIISVNYITSYIEKRKLNYAVVSYSSFAFFYRKQMLKWGLAQDVVSQPLGNNFVHKFLCYLFLLVYIYINLTFQSPAYLPIHKTSFPSIKLSYRLQTHASLLKTRWYLRL